MNVFNVRSLPVVVEERFSIGYSRVSSQHTKC